MRNVKNDQRLSPSKFNDYRKSYNSTGYGEERSHPDSADEKNLLIVKTERFLMRNLVLIIVVVLVGAAVYLVSSSSSRSPGEMAKSVVAGDLAPDFQLEDTKGNKISLSDLRGKVVMVNFWATWCPPCKLEMPSMEKLNQIMAGEDFVMLAINSEENGRSVVPAFLKNNPHDFTVLYDDNGTVQQQYGVYRFPESFIIRKDGTVDQKVVGAIDWASSETIAYFKSLTKG
jgi:peroxiredoxin